VLGGQTHWLVGDNGGWQVTSAVGAATTKFASRWAMYTYDSVFPNQVSTGLSQMAPGSVAANFLTKGLQKFTVIGPGSGERTIQDYSSGTALAFLQRPADPSSPFHTFPQVLLAAREIGAGRVVDLGFRPWSSAVAQGGFDPSVSPGGALTARSLWWATNRIPPSDTHFTLRPPNPSDRATVHVDEVHDARPVRRLGGPARKWRMLRWTEIAIQVADRDRLGRRVLTPFRIDLVWPVRRLRRFEPPRDRVCGAIERPHDADRVDRRAQCSTEIARRRTR